jgi:hypothetical protein
MIFSEMYGAYYQTVAKILEAAVSGDLTEKDLREIAGEHAFSESALTIVPALKDARWQLLGKKLETPICHVPTMPLSTIQKRWLKAISLDPRVALFGVEFPGLDDVDPLFTPDDYVVFDRYEDGDDYRNETYIHNFCAILSAIREKTPLSVRILNRNEKPILMKVLPDHLEYSEKDDKFRLISTGCRYSGTINLSKIISIQPCPDERLDPGRSRIRTSCSLTLELIDKRNAMDRLFLHFAHFEKSAERIAEDRYRVVLHYDQADETEILIRVLSFGPFVKVIEPESFIKLVRCRLRKQMELYPL